MLDSTYKIATPEGVELKIPVAGLASRSLAWLVDAFIKSVALITASIVFSIAGDFGTGLFLVFAFVLLWLYNVLFEVLNHGATPGKRVLKLRVMNLNGTPVSWTGSIIRNLIRFIDTLPGCYLFGCLCVHTTKNYQRLGDLAAGTIVVHEPQHVATQRNGDGDVLDLAIPLSLDEQQAIVSFGERAGTLNSARAEELAALIQPVIPEVNAERLKAHANWIAGGGTSN